jgi:hypothetical protein
MGGGEKCVLKNQITKAVQGWRFFMIVKIQVEVFWFGMPPSE